VPMSQHPSATHQIAHAFRCKSSELKGCSLQHSLSHNWFSFLDAAHVVPSFELSTINRIPAFRSFCDERDVRPCYFVDCAAAKGAVENGVFTNAIKQNTCELGAHLHPWANPTNERCHSTCSTKIAPRNSYPLTTSAEHLAETFHSTNRMERVRIFRKPASCERQSLPVLHNYGKPIFPGETTGLSLSPDGIFVYVTYQSVGLLFTLFRKDGLSFEAEHLDVKYASSTITIKDQCRWVRAR
jgi:hypothetical protein